MGGPVSELGRPACYEFILSGDLPEDFREIARGLNVIEETGEGKDKVIKLVSDVQDQAELIGLLNMLYNWHIVLISITRL